MRSAALIQLRTIDLHPAPDATGVNRHAAVRQEFGHVLVGQGISQIPADAQQDHLAREMAPFERIGRGDRHGLLPYQTANAIFATEPPAAEPRPLLSGSGSDRRQYLLIEAQACGMHS